MTRAHLKGYFYLTLCIVLWACIPVVSKKILVELNNLHMLFYSTIGSVIILTLTLCTQGKAQLLRRYTRRDFGRMAWFGFLGAYLYYVLLYGAFARTSAAEGFILAYTWPILVSLLGIFILKERATARRIISVCISFLGVIIIFTHGDLTNVQFTNFSGNALAIAGAFVFALFSVLGKKHAYDQSIASWIYFVSALACISITVLCTGDLPWPSPGVWFWLIMNGFFINGISYIFWFKALEYGDTGIIANALYITPFASLIFIQIFLDEPIPRSALIGLVVIACGIVIQAWRKQTQFNLHHVALTVSDIERSMQFYKHFGFTVKQRFSKQQLGAKVALLSNGTSHLELFCFESYSPLPNYRRSLASDLRTLGTKHVAFGVQNIETAIAHLREHSISVDEPTMGDSGHRYVFLSDPDEILVELFEQ